jgi:hypothetical protein
MSTQNRFAIGTVLIGIVTLLPFAADRLCGQTTTYVDAPKAFRGPLTYRDSASQTIYYVESDGRHVSAINKEGKILWHKNPFVDAGLKPYRVERPVIVNIGPAQKWMLDAMKGKGDFIQINFNSSQAGVLNTATGEFRFMGQD